MCTGDNNSTCSLVIMYVYVNILYFYYDWLYAKVIVLSEIKENNNMDQNMEFLVFIAMLSSEGSHESSHIHICRQARAFTAHIH